MEFKIDWRQKSTIRGAIWFVFSLIATALIIAGEKEGAMAVMTVAGMTAGGVGVAVRD